MSRLSVGLINMHTATGKTKSQTWNSIEDTNLNLGVK